jgi:hypothetical protein
MLWQHLVHAVDALLDELLIPASDFVLPWPLSVAGAIYGIVAAAAGAIMI